MRPEVSLAVADAEDRVGSGHRRESVSSGDSGERERVGDHFGRGFQREQAVATDDRAHEIARTVTIEPMRDGARRVRGHDDGDGAASGDRFEQIDCARSRCGPFGADELVALDYFGGAAQERFGAGGRQNRGA